MTTTRWWLCVTMETLFYIFNSTVIDWTCYILYGLTANNGCLCTQHSLIGLRNSHRLFTVRCELDFLYSVYTAMFQAWFSSVLQQTLSWYPKFTLICMILLMQLSPILTEDFSPLICMILLMQLSPILTALPAPSEVRHNAALQTPNSVQMLSSLPLLHTASSPLPHYRTFLTSQVVPCHQSGFFFFLIFI